MILRDMSDRIIYLPGHEKNPPSTYRQGTEDHRDRAGPADPARRGGPGHEQLEGSPLFGRDPARG